MNNLLARTYVKHRMIGVGTVLAPEHAEIEATLTAAIGRNVADMTNDEVLVAFKPETVSKQYSKYKQATKDTQESESE